MNRTYWAKENELTKKWYLVDAKNKILGRLAVKIADILNGKNKTIYTPNVDCGDYVIVINAKYIKVSGKKLLDKKYYRHSTYPGNLKIETLKEKLAKKPEEVIYLAVKNMLGKGPLGYRKIKKLKVYAEAEHPHQAQQPEKIEL